MMTNIFSIFDPANSTYFKMNWIIMFLYLLILPYQYWILFNRFNWFYFFMFCKILKEIKTLIIKNQFINNYLMMSIFFFITYNNFFGLFPYNFTCTSHISITIPLALSLWMSFNMYGLIMKFNMMMSHMIPNETPLSLSFFICLIETISLLSRPISLSIRLTANMIAGHLLLNLLSSMIYSINIWLFIFTPLGLLIFLEMMVSIIQGYVFMLLTIMYLNEIK